jgi:ankyrin repeat protein
LALIEKMSVAGLDVAIKKKNKGGWTPLHVAFTNCKSIKVLLALITKLSAIHLGDAIKQQNNDRWNPLHVAFRCAKSAKVVLALIEKLSVADLGAAIKQQSNGGWNPLHQAFRDKSANVVLALIEKLSVADLSAAIKQQNNDRWTPLHVAFRYHTFAKVASRLIEKLSAADLGAVIKQQNNQGFNPLHMAFEYQDKKIVEKLIERLPVRDLLVAIKQRAFDGSTPLDCADEKCKGTAIFRVVEKLINNLSKKDIYNELIQSPEEMEFMLRYMQTNKDKLYNEFLKIRIESVSLNDLSEVVHYLVNLSSNEQRKFIVKCVANRLYWHGTILTNIASDNYDYLVTLCVKYKEAFTEALEECFYQNQEKEPFKDGFGMNFGSIEHHKAPEDFLKSLHENSTIEAIMGQRRGLGSRYTFFSSHPDDPAHGCWRRLERLVKGNPAAIQFWERETGTSLPEDIEKIIQRTLVTRK